MSASTVALARSSFNGGEIAPSLYYRIELEKYIASCKKMLNFYPHPHGGASNRPGFEFVDEAKSSTTKCIVVPFQFSVTQSYMLVFGHNYIRYYKDGGYIETSSGSGVHVETATTYTEAELPLLKFDQSADTLYITHPSHAPATLTRSSHTSWTLSDITFGPGQNAPTSLTCAAGSARTYGVTAINADELESIPATVAGDRGYILNWTAPSGTAPAKYSIYEKDSGVWARIGLVEGVTTFTIPSSPSRNGDITPPKSVTIFDSANNYPGTSAFFDQRLVFARTNTKPQTLFGSVVGDFPNMNYSSPVQDDDAFNFTINSTQVNEIRWIVALTQCIIGTSGGEWVMRPGGQNTTITPTSVDIKVQSRWGVADIKPIVVGNSVLFVEGSQRAVRNLAYSLELDGYDGSNLSILANHLFEDYGIVSWCYQQYPDSILWCVREDGKLLGLSYMAEHKIVGWHVHETDGYFESVASISTAPGVNEVWAVVRRTINGSTKRYIERLSRRQFSDIKDAFFVDCGKKLYFPSGTKTLTGLNWLEGKAVSILADGSVVTGKVVTGGSVTLPAVKTYKISIGLPYVCDIETLDFTAPTPEGEVAYKSRKVAQAIVGLSKTRELFIGPSEDRLTELSFRKREAYGDPVQPFTGRKDKIAIKPAEDPRQSSLFMRVVNPLPCTIQSVIAHVSYGNK